MFRKCAFAVLAAAGVIVGVVEPPGGSAEVRAVTANLYKNGHVSTNNSIRNMTGQGANTPFARGDYAGNAGNQYSGNCDGFRSYDGGPTTIAGESSFTGWCSLKHNGVIYQRSEIAIIQLTDGTSNTYLVGEKYLNPDNYDSGNDDGDDQLVFVGQDADTLRWTQDAPKQDTPGFAGGYNFGSIHPVGFNMLLCDGSVRIIPYNIDTTVHSYLGHRSDGNAVSPP